jgi:hypothetical protein
MDHFVIVYNCATVYRDSMGVNGGNEIDREHMLGFLPWTAPQYRLG